MRDGIDLTRAEREALLDEAYPIDLEDAQRGMEMRAPHTPGMVWAAGVLAGVLGVMLGWHLVARFVA